MSTSQGNDGTPHLTYYNKVHSLSFVWDNTVGNWIDVSYGGYAEPVFARIPFELTNNLTYPADMLLNLFRGTCDAFINQIHDIEHTTIGHAHDNCGTLE